MYEQELNFYINSKHSYEGSALIVLISALFFLTVIVGTIVRMTVYSADIVACRQHAIEQLYATEALLLFAVAYCNEHPTFLKNCNERIVYDGSWFENKHAQWRGKVALTLKDTAGLMEARLYDQSNLIALHTCVVSICDKAMKIAEWKS